MSATIRKHLIYTWLAAVSVLLGVLGWGQAVAERRVTEMVELDVQRINIREPDGTLRMTISNSATLPGLIIKGTEHPFPNRMAAGILFFNDEGTENGGLLFGGGKRGQNASTGGHLSFDQYEQDQVISLDQTEDHGRRHAGLTFFDRPSTSLPVDLVENLGTPEGSAEFETMARAGAFGYPRLFIGKNEEHESTVVLRDAKGLVRLRLAVTPLGVASIEFIDATGKVVRRLLEK